MIATTTIHTCRACGSTDIVKNGLNAYGNQQYRCKACGGFKVLEPKRRYSDARKEEILRAYQERASLRGVCRIFGVSRTALTRWLAAKLEGLHALEDTLEPVQAEDVLEMDEVWSFVGQRHAKVWLWTVLCRRTRQIIAFVNGDRSQKTCEALWDAIPAGYKDCRTFSDFWACYQAVFPAETHTSGGKETGQTNHMERWNNTLRQRLGRLTRKTLSFSKSFWWHDKVIHWFIISYNLSVIK